MFKLKNKLIFFIGLSLFINPLSLVQAKTFKIATYNIENLFDLEKSGNEYIEYVPNNIFCWNEKNFNLKLNNISAVLKDLNADIIALQEIESESALQSLQTRLREKNLEYKYSAIAKVKNTTVKCAVLSKYPIIKTQEILIPDSKTRNILKVLIDLENNPLILYINHWKSKSGPESLRIESAQALRKDIEHLPADTDFIILGDFNSNYNEYQSIKKIKRLNNRDGLTGINHILKTTADSKMVTEQLLSQEQSNPLLYNLWLEIPAAQRWSYDSTGSKDSPDSIILNQGLYDNKGIAYIDNSFSRFTPAYLFKHGEVFRWQKAKNGAGMHLGSGYSDHLPIFALFSAEPFSFKKANKPLLADDLSVNNQAIQTQGLVDLNIGTKKELMAISGIGKVLADKIIAGRPYQSIDDLIKVNGIGKKKLESIRGYLIIQNKQNQ
ncbi:MAG: helix-hairpin-helix domain-containing protein [Candidatus Omnitrophica bacterium]|nr:helix-hairpin-helix domain-containing protein [Candidatus Omnitrophota bacterium]